MNDTLAVELELLDIIQQIKAELTERSGKND